jgi:hypothetical protein
VRMNAMMERSGSKIWKLKQKKRYLLTHFKRD